MGDITAGVFAPDKQMSRKFPLSCKGTFPEDLFAMNDCFSLLECKLFSFIRISTAFADSQRYRCTHFVVLGSHHPRMAVKRSLLQPRGWFAEPCLLQVQDCLPTQECSENEPAKCTHPSSQQTLRSRSRSLVPHLRYVGGACSKIFMPSLAGGGYS